MKKTFILLMSLVALVAANLSAKAQEVTTAEVSKGGDVVRPLNIFNTDGNWNDGSKWSTGVVPDPGSDVVIMAHVVIPAGYIAIANEVSLEGGSITVSDGGQLRHNTDDLVVTMKKNIEPYSVVNGTDNYYLLGFPFSEEVAIPDDMTADGCDFYKFDGDYPNAEWRNNRMHPITTVGDTTGYLYASPEAIEISLTGSFKVMYNEEEHVYQPEEFGMHVINPSELYGGATVQDAKGVFDNVLENRATKAQKNVVLINAAFAIHVIEQEMTFQECLSLARESLESGAALNVLRNYIAFMS